MIVYKYSKDGGIIYVSPKNYAPQKYSAYAIILSSPILERKIKDHRFRRIGITFPRMLVRFFIHTADEDLKQTEMLMPTIGSDALLGLHLQRFGSGYALYIEEDTAEPIHLHYKTAGFYTPSTFIKIGRASCRERV